MQINTWQEWLDTLGEALNRAEEMKMPKKIISKSAAQMGEFLFEIIDPNVPENRLLKNMWGLADDKEREALASVMIKLVDKKSTH